MKEVAGATALMLDASGNVNLPGPIPKEAYLLSSKDQVRPLCSCVNDSLATLGACRQHSQSFS